MHLSLMSDYRTLTTKVYALMANPVYLIERQASFMICAFPSSHGATAEDARQFPV